MNLPSFQGMSDGTWNMPSSDLSAESRILAYSALTCEKRGSRSHFKARKSSDVGQGARKRQKRESGGLSAARGENLRGDNPQNQGVDAK